MFGTALIVFREVFEAALIISIVLAASRGVPRRNIWIAGGVLLGSLGATFVAYFAERLSNAFDGVGQELFNAGILFSAVLMLGWHNVWMARHGREMAQEMTAVGNAVRTGGRPLYALMLAVALAVLREGSEVVLFLYGIAAGGSGGGTMLSGALVGFAGGIAVGMLLYFGLLRMSPRHLFTATSWMILLLAAGMAAQSAAFLEQAGWVPVLIPRVWDSSGWLPENSVFGQIAHALVGYVATPSGIQLVFYIVTLLVIGGAMKLWGRVAAPPPVLVVKKAA